MANNLFARKPLDMLLAEAKDDNRLRRILGPVQLTSLGVGAIIGAGIFVATGAAGGRPPLHSLPRRQPGEGWGGGS